MLRFKLKELIAKREFEERRRLLLQEIAEETGITRNTLSKVLHQHGVSMRTDNLDRLCAYFACKIEDLVEYVPEEQVSAPSLKK
jgi:putative transcriptional regulator